MNKERKFGEIALAISGVYMGLKLLKRQKDLLQKSLLSHNYFKKTIMYQIPMPIYNNTLRKYKDHMPPKSSKFDDSHRENCAFKFSYLTHSKIMCSKKLKQLCSKKLDAPNLKKVVVENEAISVDLKVHTS